MYNKEKTLKFVKFYDPEPRPREYYLVYTCTPPPKEKWDEVEPKVTEFLGILTVFNDQNYIILPTLIETFTKTPAPPIVQTAIGELRILLGIN